MKQTIHNKKERKKGSSMSIKGVSLPKTEDLSLAYFYKTKLERKKRFSIKLEIRNKRCHSCFQVCPSK